MPVRRIGLSDLEHSRVDWASFSPRDRPRSTCRCTARRRRGPTSATAIDKVTAGFGETDRGKLIMACGTGKTFTSLRLAEENVGAGGTVLFLVPSISLLSQTVREWVGEADAADPPAGGVLRRQVDQALRQHRRGHLRHRPRAAGDDQRRRC